MACPVRSASRCTTVRLSSLSKLEGLPTESSLVDLPFLGPGEGHTVVLELDDCIRGPLDTCSEWRLGLRASLIPLPYRTCMQRSATVNT